MKWFTARTVFLLWCVIALFILTFVMRDRPAPMSVNLAAPGVTTVQVPEAVVTTKTVTKVVTDPAAQAQADALLARNKSLEEQVVSLTTALATATSKGGGPVTVNAPATPDAGFSFDDHRLLVDVSHGQLTYALTQRFVVASTIGRKSDGTPLGLVALSEILPDGSIHRIPVTSTTIFADQTRPHWFIGLTVQGGLAATVTPDGAQTGGVVAAPWWKRGRTNAAADTSLAVLTPAVFLAPGTVSWAVLPVSVNVAIKPFQNLWLSPLIGSRRAGVVLSATF